MSARDDDVRRVIGAVIAASSPDVTLFVARDPVAVLAPAAVHVVARRSAHPCLAPVIRRSDGPAADALRHPARTSSGMAVIIRSRGRS